MLGALGEPSLRTGAMISHVLLPRVEASSDVLIVAYGTPIPFKAPLLAYWVLLAEFPLVKIAERLCYFTWDRPVWNPRWYVLESFL
jgi:hypothetical protein